MLKTAPQDSVTCDQFERAPILKKGRTSTTEYSPLNKPTWELQALMPPPMGSDIDSCEREFVICGS